ncbi:MAG: hypothetical protein QXK06_01420 [Candidatus Diapherotrites archaeon]
MAKEKKTEKIALKPAEKPETAKKAEKASTKKPECSEVEEKLPFPRATVTNMIRKHVGPGKQIKGRVKVEMNKWLGHMVEKISKEMGSYPYTYVDYAMFQDAIAKYTKLEEIADERDRILKYLAKIKSDCEFLELEVKKKFELEEGDLVERAKAKEEQKN